jgi:hypothetical protein
MSQRSVVGLMLRMGMRGLFVMAAVSPSWLSAQAPESSTLQAPADVALVARADSDTQPSPTTAKPGHATKTGKFKHGDWPFKPPTRPTVPDVADLSWIKTPVDAFIVARLEVQGLRPSAPADKRTLLRRVTFDLTGLPPTFEEIGEFLADNSPDAYEKVVERLLASPHYGERWAQHWLDVVRYAETDGFKQDAVRPNAYRYRDYVIRSLNEDLPFDRFVRQQLAGDELEPDNPDALIATGLNRLYPDEFNAANVKQRRQEILDEITDVTGQTFLGLTMGCAQCHDHKFDEILQTDYFGLQAFFTPMLPRDDVVIASAEDRRKFAEQQSAWEDATREIRAEIDAILKPHAEKTFRDAIEKYEQDIQAILLMRPEERNEQQQQWAVQAEKLLVGKLDEAIKKLKGVEKDRYEELQKKLAEFNHLKPRPLPTAMAITDAGPQSPPTYRLATGNFTRPQEKVEPGFPSFLGASKPVIQPSPSAPESTGRRSALARWLTRPDHPLTARVMMNRIWQHHFGEGIVGTSNDFGAMGDEPTHPELLDWLAVEFVERGWSLKAMHRLIVTSAAYQQSSLVDPDSPAHQKALEADPQNNLLWHARRRRLDGESIRDAMLSISGQVNLRMYGESARPELPAGLKSTYAWKADDKPEDRNRRSIYVFARRNLRLPLLESFDLPDMHNSCPRRANTTTAPQALHLLNSEFVLDQARHLAGRVLNDYCECEGEDARIRMVYELAFGRVPSIEESAAAVGFVERQARLITDRSPNVNPDMLPIPQPESGLEPAHAAAYVDLCHALINSNEFLFVD